MDWRSSQTSFSTEWIFVPRTYVPLSRSAVNNLIDQARLGSIEASGELLEACRGYLLLIANGQLDADLRQKLGGSDLVQETFVQAHRDFVRFNGGSNANCWPGCVRFC